MGQRKIAFDAKIKKLKFFFFNKENQKVRSDIITIFNISEVIMWDGDQLFPISTKDIRRKNAFKL